MKMPRQKHPGYENEQNETENEQYRIYACCLNCGYSNWIFLSRGVAVKDALKSVSCPVCGCRTMEKNNE